MEYLKVQTTKGISTERVYNVDDFPYCSIHMNTCNGKRKMYYNVSCAFDIESTSIEPPTTDGKKKNSSNDYIYTPYSFMYHWQFCLDNKVIFGRTWEEFCILMHNLVEYFQLSSNKILVIYVHNLSYEFQFIKDFINITSIFAKDTRKPIKVSTYGIEFRCSYFLSNMSLIKFCENSKNCTHHKLVDTFDYSKVRTPYTELTELEMGYCYNDVRGLCECIDNLLIDDTIATIPLTNTGYVRRDFRIAMNTKSNRRLFEKIALNEEEYTLLKECFRGGNTHANRFKVNKILKNVHSYDLQSSYPAKMMLDVFPIGKFQKVTFNSLKKLRYYCEKYCVIMRISFFDIEANENNVIPYIDIAHCKKRKNYINDNGRILKADYIQMSITNIDFDIINETYTYGDIVINEAFFAERGKLPREFREILLKYYDGKTQLKGIKDKYYEYMKSKNKVNSSFGMMVTDIAHSEIEYNAGNWSEKKPNITDALEKYYKTRNSFLSYQWGVFVTANARRELQDMLNVVGFDVVYCDTDSIKFVREEHIAEFEEKNKELIERVNKNDIRAYSEKDGKKYYLGIWDYEGKYERFKTLGAKKYCDEIENKNGIKFEITVSGMSKDKGAERISSIENFNICTTLFDVGRTTSWYNDEKPHDIIVNEETFTTASNIAILDTTYTLGVTNEYYELLVDSQDGSRETIGILRGEI